MFEMDMEAVQDLAWRECDENPLIHPTFPSPMLADPTFLPPAETPDGVWHLFAHSILGIHHFTSRDGLAWVRCKGAVSRNSLRAFLFVMDSTYYLFYERYLKLFPFPYLSRIEARTSRDLLSWSRPSVVLEPSLAWHREGCKGAVSNPCVVAVEDGFERREHAAAAQAQRRPGVGRDGIITLGDRPARLADIAHAGEQVEAS